MIEITRQPGDFFMHLHKNQPMRKQKIPASRERESP
jgi:hypothetical protein